jgi:beta-lactam-binding protein with PASTA domain
VVPKLVGESFDQAVQDVERVGLRQEAPGFPGTLGNPDYGGNCLRVSSQSPPPGTKLRKGDTVAIVYGVCKGRITGGHGG